MAEQWRQIWCEGVYARALTCVLLSLLLVTVPQLSWATEVKEVDVHLELSRGYLGAEPMGRLETALRETVELVILDKLRGDLDYIETHQSNVTNTLGQVVESALSSRGFSLEHLVLEPGETTLVELKFHLANRQVQSFAVRFMLLGNTPIIESACSSDAEAIAQALYTSLARTPYDDGEWLSKLVKTEVMEHLAQLPAYQEFEPLVLVHPGERTEVMVSLTPEAGCQLVRGHTISVRSATLLNYMLNPVREELAYYLRSLYGAPLSFISAKSNELSQAIYQEVVNQPLLQRHEAEAELDLIQRGTQVDAVMLVNSRHVALELIARLDLIAHDFHAPGNAQHDEIHGRFGGRGGIFVSDLWAFVSRADYYPGHDQVYPMLGVGHVIDEDGFLSLGYDFSATGWRFEGFKPLNRHVVLRGNIYTEDDYQALSELSLGYLLRDMYELQLVVNLDGEAYVGVAASF